MIYALLIALFLIVSTVSLAVLADSAVRARNSWTSLRREMVLQSGQIARTSADVVMIRPVVAVQGPAATPCRAPRLPQAVAA